MLRTCFKLLHVLSCCFWLCKVALDCFGVPSTVVAGLFEVLCIPALALARVLLQWSQSGSHGASLHGHCGRTTGDTQRFERDPRLMSTALRKLPATTSATNVGRQGIASGRLCMNSRFSWPKRRMRPFG